MGKQVLLVDDDTLVLKTLTRLLEKAGHMVRAFQDSREAIQAVMCEDFDLVITDIRMPNIDGYQTIRYVREIRSKNQKEPAKEIMITGYAEDLEEVQNKVKPHAMIFKPFDVNEFIDIVNRVLEEKT